MKILGEPGTAFWVGTEVACLSCGTRFVLEALDPLRAVRVGSGQYQRWAVAGQCPVCRVPFEVHDDRTRATREREEVSP